MLTETGRIVAVESDGLWVETTKQSACAQCNASKGCGQKLLASVAQNMAHIKAEFDEKNLSQQSRIWVVGAEVTIGIQEGAVVKGAMITYLIPLLLMLFFGGISSGLALSEIYVAAFSFSGLLLGGWLVSRFSRQVAQSADARVIVVS